MDRINSPHILSIFHHLPEGLLQREANQLHEVLSGPTLIHMRGRRARPLFVSVLLHGNEITGWLAMRELLRRYADRELPRSLSLFIGNVAAARHGLRRENSQPDYNRIWKGGSRPEHAMVGRVLDEMRARKVFAAMDVHNNTGFNPHYACVNVLDQRHLQMATMYSRTVVYFIKPDTVSSLAFAAICPSVTLECGQPGHAYGTKHVLEYLDSCLRMAKVPTHPVAAHDIDLFHTVAVVKVPAETSFGFEEDATEIWFAGDLDHLNFHELPRGTTLGWVREGADVCLEAWDEAGNDIGSRYFSVDEGEIKTHVPVMPSMLTLDERVIRQDCLCYLLERYRAPGPA